jgi:hypothetical protein
MKLFLFATNHNVQCGLTPRDLPDETKRFCAEVRSIVRVHAISLLAEELNHEVLSITVARLTRSKSVLEGLAVGLGISHMYCEPTRAERDKTKLEKSDLWKWRESQWLEKLTASKLTPILFVLGADHLNSFGELTRQNHAIETIVLHCDWGSSEDGEVF